LSGGFRLKNKIATHQSPDCWNWRRVGVLLPIMGLAACAHDAGGSGDARSDEVIKSSIASVPSRTCMPLPFTPPQNGVLVSILDVTTGRSHYATVDYDTREAKRAFADPEGGSSGAVLASVIVGAVFRVEDYQFDLIQSFAAPFLNPMVMKGIPPSPGTNTIVQLHLFKRSKETCQYTNGVDSAAYANLIHRIDAAAGGDRP